MGKLASLALLCVLALRAQYVPPGGGAGGGGTTSSVGLSMPATFCAVTNSPVTTTGTLTCAYATGQTASLIFGTNGSGNVGLMNLTTAQLPAIASTFLSDSSSLVRTTDTGSVTNTMLAGSIANAKLSNSSLTIAGHAVSLGGTQTLASTDLSDTSSLVRNTLTSAHLLVGNVSNVATDVALSGDCTVTNAGAITCTKINSTTPGGTCTNQAVTSVSASAVPTCTTLTSAYTSGTFSATAHNLLSATHGDTTASSAVRGGGIFAIGASPTWTQLAHSSATGGYFKWNGTDIVASTGAAAGTGSCTNQAVTVENADAAPTCTTLTSAYVNNSIALTGTDINTSNQVTATHLAAALPVNQGGTGTTSPATVAGTNVTVSGSFPNQTVNAIPGCSTVAAASSGINTTETAIVSCTIPANTLVAGSEYRLTASGTGTTTVANSNTFRVRVGTAGTSSDVAVATLTLTAGTTGTGIVFFTEFVFTVRTIGAGGTAIAGGWFSNASSTGLNNAGSGTQSMAQPSATQTIDTTVQNTLQLSYVSVATTTTATFQMGAIERIK